MRSKRAKRQEKRHVSTGSEHRAKATPVPVGIQRKADFARRSFKFSDTASSAPATGKSARKLPPRPGELPSADEAPDPSEVLNRFSPSKP